MFLLYGYGVPQECYIEDSVLYVIDPLTDKKEGYEINSTQFFKTHTLLKDDAKRITLHPNVMWTIETNDGYIINGNIHGTLNVIKDYQVISCTSWNRDRVLKPVLHVGFFRGTSNHLVYLDQVHPDHIYAGVGTHAMALLKEPVELSSEFSDNLEVWLNDSLHAFSLAGPNVRNVFYVLGGENNDGILRCRVEAVTPRGTSPIRVPV